LTVVSSVAATYFQALELRDRIEVAQQNLSNGQKILEGLQYELAAGIATGLDVAQQETAVALLKAALPPLLQQFRQTVYALAVLLGKTPESFDVARARSTTCRAPPSSRACLRNFYRDGRMSPKRNNSSLPPMRTSRWHARRCSPPST